MGISWKDRVSNIEVLRRANMPSVEAMLVKNQLRWAGHLVRMDSHRIPSQVFYGELMYGQPESW